MNSYLVKIGAYFRLFRDFVQDANKGRSFYIAAETYFQYNFFTIYHANI